MENQSSNEEENFEATSPIQKKNKGIWPLSGVDTFLLIFLLILFLLTYLAWKYPTIGQYFELTEWFGTDNAASVSFWAAIGFTMIACFLGALIPIPIPYAIPVSVFSAAWLVTMPNPWPPIIMLVLMAAIANTIGDFLDYVLGKGTNYLMSKEDPDLENKWAKLVLKKPKTIPFIVFLFGLTPLPDSVLLVPLGLVNYSPKKTLLWMFIGKLFMMIIFAIAGIFGLEWLLNLLSGSEEGSGWISGMVLLYIVWLIMVIMTKIKPPE